MEHFSRLEKDEDFEFIYERWRVMDQPSVSGGDTGPSTSHEVVSGDIEDVDEVRWSEDGMEYRLFDGELSPATEVLEVDMSDGTVVYTTEDEPAMFGGEDVGADVSGALPYLSNVLDALNGYAEEQNSGLDRDDASEYLDSLEEALEEGSDSPELPVATSASECLDALKGAVADIREEVKDDMY